MSTPRPFDPDALVPALMRIPGVVAVTLGGSRATGSAVAGSDWDLGLYYRGTVDPDDVRALGYPGAVSAPGEWGRIVNGGAWLTIDGERVDLIYRDVDEVVHWTAEAEAGRFEVFREIGYVAGITTYSLAGELALGQVLAGAGTLPQPATFPDALRASAPQRWTRLAAGALYFARVHHDRGDRVAATANATLAVLATAHARVTAAGRWVLNEKRLTAAAGLAAAADTIGAGGTVDLDALARLLDLPPWP